VLKRPGDFERFLGSDVCVKLYQPMDGSKQFVGVLQSYEDGSVTVLQNGKPRTFDKSTVAQVRLHITF
jgi:ribosome maturation factor RimP